jgi:hypothetical protein
MRLPGVLQTRAHDPRLQHNTRLDNRLASASPLRAGCAACCHSADRDRFPDLGDARACWTSRSNVDRDKVKIEVPQIDLPPLDFRDTEQ